MHFHGIRHVRKAQSGVRTPGLESCLFLSPTSYSQAILPASQDLLSTSHPCFSVADAQELLGSLFTHSSAKPSFDLRGGY